MNEPANFCEGICFDGPTDLNNLKPEYINEDDDLPYRIGDEDLE